MGDHQDLWGGWLCLPSFDVLREAVDVILVEVGVDFIEQDHRWALLRSKSKDESQACDGLLSSRARRDVVFELLVGWLEVVNEILEPISIWLLSVYALQTCVPAHAASQPGIHLIHSGSYAVKVAQELGPSLALDFSEFILSFGDLARYGVNFFLEGADNLVQLGLLFVAFDDYLDVLVVIIFLFSQTN